MTDWTADSDVPSDSGETVDGELVLAVDPYFVIGRRRPRLFTVSSMAQRFNVKGPMEAVPLTFDFTADLPAGVTLAGTPVFAFATRAGADDDPSDIQNGAAGFDSTLCKVVLPVQGGLDGCEYLISCTCPTTQASPPLVLALVGVLPVSANLN